MKRKITETLEKWKESTRKKSLLIYGARQVGKTYIIDEFAKNNYPKNKIISINFELFPESKEFFEFDLTPKSILNKIQSNIKFKDIDFKDDENNPYFIFLDEIQSCENALIALKAFTMEKKLYHVIGTGSLLGVALKRKFSGLYPVGYVQHLQMYPFDFEEFLWANGFTQAYIDNLRNQFHLKGSLPLSSHEQLMDLFRKYVVIGGLPEAINTFLETNSYDDVYQVQNDLLIGYIQDIRKYAESNELKIKIEKCLKSIPNHLKEQNKKFMYKRVEHNGRERMFSGALDWLNDAGLVIFCENTKRIQIPIESYAIENSFKLYLFDTGILMSMFIPEKRYNVLNGSDDLDIGGIYENAIACILSKKQNTNQLFYYNDNVIDIDFVGKDNEKLLAIEVKSGNNLKSISLNKFAKENNDANISLIKISSKIVKENDIITNIPFYEFALGE